MPEFSADSSLEPLEFDFTAFGAGKGTIPEPSEAVILAYESARASVTDFETQLDAYALLCQGSPSRDQLEALPPRLRAAFGRWLVGAVGAPKGVAADRPVRVDGITLEKRQPATDSAVSRIGGPLAEALDAETYEDVLAHVAVPLATAFDEGAHWAQQELLSQLAAAGIHVSVLTADDIARSLLSQLNEPESAEG